MSSSVTPVTNGSAAPRLTASALILISAVLFGISPVLVKVAYTYGVSTLTVLAARGTLATACLWAGIVVTRTRVAPSARSFLVLAAIGATLVPAQVFAYFLALVYLPASSASVLANTYPLHVAWMGWIFLRERMRTEEIAVMIAIVGGAVLVAGQTPAAGSGPGLALVAAGTLISALYVVVARRVVRDVSPIDAMAVILPVSALVYWIAGLATRQLIYPVPAPAALAIVGSAAAASVVAPLLQLWGLRAVPAVRTAILGTLEPVVTAGLSVAVLGDHMTPLRAAGIAVVIGGIAVLHLRRTA
jgi:drug/metabolite transporter (DMT)-like permease